MTQDEFEEEKRKLQDKKNELSIVNKVDDSIAKCYDNSLSQNTHKLQNLTNKLVDAELDVKESQIEGRKATIKAGIEKDVTKAKTEVDVEKTERAKTILKAQGLTEKLPPAFRVTALVIGFPFFLVYLLTLGWVIEFVTFVVKGFLTMIFDCAERYADLNAKFTANENNKSFNVGKAVVGVVKWALIVSAVVVILILLMKK